MSHPDADSPKPFAPAADALAAAALLLLFAVLAVAGAERMSPTFDEAPHLYSGVTYWRLGDYRMNPENGNFPQRWAALPVAMSNATLPDHDNAAWRQSEFWPLADRFFYFEGNDLQEMLMRGRAMIVALGVLLGVVIYAWSRMIFGRTGALLSLAVYCLSPSMLAHGSLITSDFAAAAFFTSSLLALWMLLHRVTWLTLGASVLSMGLMFLSKMSGALLVPMGVMLVAVRLTSSQPIKVNLFGRREVAGRLKQASLCAGLVVVHVLGVALLIWAAFGFRYAAMSDPTAADQLRRSWDALITDGDKVRFLELRVVALVRDLRLLPEAYLYGFCYIFKNALTREAFLSGEYALKGFTWYFPITVAIKTPLAVWALLLLAGAAAVLRWAGVGESQRASFCHRMWRGLYQTAPLWALLVVYWWFSIGTVMNIGERHLLPTYPPMFILAGGAAWWLTQRRLASRAMVAALVVWLAVETLLIWPHHLSYFNQFVGGPKHAYRVVVDSSLDWGQDLKTLKRWLDDRELPKRHRVYFSYFGPTAALQHYDIDVTTLPNVWANFTVYKEPGPTLEAGTYLISATSLQHVVSRAPGRWCKPYEQLYQRVRQQLTDVRAGKLNLPDEALHDLYTKHRWLRFARLSASLRQREPDDWVGYSILVYELTDADIDAALHGPPAELADEITVKPKVAIDRSILRWYGLEHIRDPQPEPAGGSGGSPASEAEGGAP